MSNFYASGGYSTRYAASNTSTPFSSTPQPSRPPRPRFSYSGPPFNPRPRSSASKPNPGHSEDRHYDSVNNNFGNTYSHMDDSFSSFGNNTGASEYHTANESFGSPYSSDSFLGSPRGSSRPYRVTYGQLEDYPVQPGSYLDQIRDLPGQTRNLPGQSVGYPSLGYPTSLSRSSDPSSLYSGVMDGYSGALNTYPGSGLGPGGYSATAGGERLRPSLSQRGSRGGYPGFSKPVEQTRYDPVKEYRGRGGGARGRGWFRGRSGKPNNKNSIVSDKPIFNNKAASYGGHLEIRDGTSKWSCEVCKINFTSGNPLGAHLKGVKHAKKVRIRQTQPGIDNSVEQLQENKYKCKICNIETNSAVTMQMHIEGAKHKNKMKIMAGDGLGKTNSVNSVSGKASDDQKCIEHVKENMFKCTLCEVVTNSTVQMQMHIEGAKHRNKLNPPVVNDGENSKKARNKRKNDPENETLEKDEKLQKTSDEVSQPTEDANADVPMDTAESEPKKLKIGCEICNVVVNSQFQLDQHFESKKHKDRVAGKPVVQHTFNKFKKPKPKKQAAGTIANQTVLGIKTLQSCFVRKEVLE